MNCQDIFMIKYYHRLDHIRNYSPKKPKVVIGHIVSELILPTETTEFTTERNIYYNGKSSLIIIIKSLFLLLLFSSSRIQNSKNDTSLFHKLLPVYHICYTLFHNPQLN